MFYDKHTQRSVCIVIPYANTRAAPRQTGREYHLTHTHTHAHTPYVRIHSCLIVADHPLSQVKKIYHYFCHFVVITTQLPQFLSLYTFQEMCIDHVTAFFIAHVLCAGGWGFSAVHAILIIRFCSFSGSIRILITHDITIHDAAGAHGDIVLENLSVEDQHGSICALDPKRLSQLVCSLSHLERKS